MTEPTSRNALARRRRPRVRAGEAASTAAACPRLPGLDALRTASMVAVVVAHAATAYVSIPLRVVPWAVYDRSRSIAFDLVVWSTISWAMPAFFALGGFAAAAIWAAKGPRGFVGDRARRIAGPAAAACPLVLLPTLVVWSAGWVASGRTTFGQLLTLGVLDPEVRGNAFGPAHLWFLEYLLLMLAAYYGVRSWRRSEPGRPGGWMFSWAGPLILAVPTALLLALGHAVNGLDPILDLRNRFVPEPIRWAHHGWFFVVGAWLFAGRAALPRLARLAPGFLLVALGAFVARAALLRVDLTSGLAGMQVWASAGSAALFAWSALFGSIGLALRVERSSGWVRYLSGSSYWIYLTHFPVVGLAQVGLYAMAWPSGVKFGITLGATMAVGLISYEWFVRRSAVGRWLGGTKPAAVLAGPHVGRERTLVR